MYSVKSRSLDTNGRCFLCLKDLILQNQCNFSLDILYQILKVNISEILNEVKSEENIKTNVSLCDSCEKILLKVQELYRILELTKRELNHHLDLVKQTVSDDKDAFSDDEQFEMLMSGGDDGLLQLMIFDKLRKEILDKCSKRSSNVEPCVGRPPMVPAISSTQSFEDGEGVTPKQDILESPVQDNLKDEMDSEEEPSFVEVVMPEDRLLSFLEISDEDEMEATNTPDPLLDSPQQDNYKNGINLEGHSPSESVTNCADFGPPGKNFCNLCQKYFSHKTNIKIHQREVHSGVKYKCDVANCSRSYTRKRTLNEHKKVAHGPVRLHARDYFHFFDVIGTLDKTSFKCKLCGRIFPSRKYFQTHYNRMHLNLPGKGEAEGKKLSRIN